MSRKLLRNCVLFDPEAGEPRPGALLLEGGRIEAALDPGERPEGVEVEDVEVVDLGGAGVAPGFLDLHFHGRTIFAEPGASEAALRHDAAELLRHGTTGFLATTVAETAEALAERVGELASAEPVGDDASCLLGIHLEGPWINPAAAGAQPAPGIREAADVSELVALLDRAEGAIRMVTLAPEVDGSPALQECLARREVVTALGHSLADAEQVGEAVERGARHVTHLFNAMGLLHHRAPGLAGAALADDRLSCDLICDGAHVDPSWVRVAARSKQDALMLISDRIDPPPGAMGFGSGALRSDGVALRLPDGRLAGSCVTLARSIANAVAFAAMTRLEAIRACTLRPARLLGLEAERGSLRRGARADLAVLDAEGRVAQSWLAGRRVH